MAISSIFLSSFRNHKEKKIEFCKGLTVIWGENGSGKTSVLEAIHTLSMGKSFRTHRQKTLIKNGEKGYLIKGCFSNKEEESIIASQLLKKGAQKTKINGKKIFTRKDLIGKNNVVLLSPEEQNITKGGPSERRRFFDRLFSVVSFYYIDVLQKYNRALKQRNAVLATLQNNSGSQDTFMEWDEKLSDYGVRLWKTRCSFIKEFQSHVETAIKKYSGEIKLALEYKEPNHLKKDYMKKLFDNKNKDMKNKVTSFGPHRDNISIRYNNNKLRLFGSQGEHKIALVLLKVAEVLFIKKETGLYPMLLLDDVFAKLDITRSKKLVRLIKDLEVESRDQLQTIVTTTDIVDVKKSGLFDFEKETVTHHLKRTCNT